jgi:hypothetical protein
MIAPTEVKISEATDESITRIASAVNILTENFGRTYERLNYPGFVSVLGGLLVFLPFCLGRLVLVSITFEEQQLYVVSGGLFVIIAAAWITIQNVLIYKLQRAKQEVACKMLAIKVSAMGETQRAALEVIQDTKTEGLSDDPFKTK